VPYVWGRKYHLPHLGRRGEEAAGGIAALVTGGGPDSSGKVHRSCLCVVRDGEFCSETVVDDGRHCRIGQWTWW